MLRNRTRNPWILLLLLATGAVIGSFLGSYLSQFLPFLKYSYPLGIREPLYLDLGIFSLIFGFVININIAGIIGLILAIMIFNRI